MEGQLRTGAAISGRAMWELVPVEDMCSGGCCEWKGSVTPRKPVNGRTMWKLGAR